TVCDMVISFVVVQMTRPSCLDDLVVGKTETKIMLRLISENSGGKLAFLDYFSFFFQPGFRLLFFTAT
ncbi:Hypothetical protein, putative, partial [Bodo saltans]